MNNKDYLAHYGIKGQKWGLRRYQNPDGTYTAAGKARRNKGTGKSSYGKGKGNGNGGNQGWVYDNKFDDEDSAKSYVKADIASRNAKQILDSEKNISNDLKYATEGIDALNRSRQISKYRQTGLDKNIRNDEIQKAIERMDLENRFYDQKYKYDTQGKARASDALKLIGGLTAAGVGVALAASMIRKNNLDAARIKKAVYGGKKEDSKQNTKYGKNFLKDQLTKELGDMAELDRRRYADTVKLAQAKQKAKTTVKKAKIKAKTDQAVAKAKNLSTDYNKDGTLTDKGRDKLIRQLVKNEQVIRSATRSVRNADKFGNVTGAVVPLASMGLLGAVSPAVMAAFPATAGIGGAMLAGTAIKKLSSTGVKALGQKEIESANVKAASIRNRLDEDDRKRRAMAHSEDFLAHYGIKGQKWGVRRFQNSDGSYTHEGKIRYGRIKNSGKKPKYGSQYNDYDDDYDYDDYGGSSYDKYVSRANRGSSDKDYSYKMNLTPNSKLRTAGTVLAGLALASMGTKYLMKNFDDLYTINKLDKHAVENSMKIMDLKNANKMKKIENRYENGGLVKRAIKGIKNFTLKGSKKAFEDVNDRKTVKLFANGKKASDDAIRKLANKPIKGIDVKPTSVKPKKKKDKIVQKVMEPVSSGKTVKLFNNGKQTSDKAISKLITTTAKPDKRSVELSDKAISKLITNTSKPYKRSVELSNKAISKLITTTKPDKRSIELDTLSSIYKKPEYRIPGTNLQVLSENQVAHLYNTKGFKGALEELEKARRKVSPNQTIKDLEKARSELANSNSEFDKIFDEMNKTVRKKGKEFRKWGNS